MELRQKSKCSCWIVYLCRFMWCIKLIKGMMYKIVHTVSVGKECWLVMQLCHHHCQWWCNTSRPGLNVIDVYQHRVQLQAAHMKLSSLQAVRNHHLSTCRYCRTRTKPDLRLLLSAKSSFVDLKQTVSNRRTRYLSWLCKHLDTILPNGLLAVPDVTTQQALALYCNASMNWSVD